MDASQGTEKLALITVITPSYNQGKYIRETIESVIKQDYAAIEYLVIDGGSTDETLDILKGYGDRFKWVSEKDQGQADAIKKGFLRAKGDVIAWLNSDDTYSAGAIGKIMNIFNACPDIDMIYGKSFYVDDRGRITGEYSTREFDADLLPTFNFFSQPSVFFRKEAYMKVNGINSGLVYTMDYDLWIKMARHCTVMYYNDYLSSYRLHGESKTVSEKQALANSREALQVVLKHFSWAPFSRVYAYTYNRLKAHMPKAVGAHHMLLLPFVLIASLYTYVKLNRGFNLKDFKSIRYANLVKLISGRRGYE